MIQSIARSRQHAASFGVYFSGICVGITLGIYTTCNISLEHGHIQLILNAQALPRIVAAYLRTQQSLTTPAASPIALQSLHARLSYWEQTTRTQIWVLEAAIKEGSHESRSADTLQQLQDIHARIGQLNQKLRGIVRKTRSIQMAAMKHGHKKPGLPKPSAAEGGSGASASPGMSEPPVSHGFLDWVSRHKAAFQAFLTTGTWPTVSRAPPDEQMLAQAKLARQIQNDMAGIGRQVVKLSQEIDQVAIDARHVIDGYDDSDTTESRMPAGISSGSTDPISMRVVIARKDSENQSGRV